MNTLASIIHNANTVLIASGNLDAIEQYFATDYVLHLTGQDLAGGRDTVRGGLDALMRAFSNIDVKVDILLEGNERVAWQRTMTATHSGSFKGFPASGREITWRDMVVSQFEDGLIKEEWLGTDLAERLLLSRKKRK